MGRKTVSAATSHRRDPDLVRAVAKFKNNPLGYVLFAFDWGNGELKNETGPDKWQEEYLRDLGRRCEEQEKNGGAVIRIAVASGNGAGKTALVSWILMWWLSCRTEPQTVVTANTAVQLETKTWRELAKWKRRAINGDWFEVNAKKIYLKGRAQTHFAAAIPWSPQRAEAFAGTHDHSVMLVFDEASGIDDVIWDTAEGAFTTPGCVFLVFGNPTRSSGRFRECWGRFRERWKRYEIDTRTCKAANQKQIQEWIEDYGIDSDIVRWRVLGQFPRAASTQLISTEDVENAQVRKEEVVGNYPAWMDFPLVIGVDVARYGDDRTVILARQGPKIHAIRRFESLSTVQVAFRVHELARHIETEHEVRVESIFVDAGGVGAGVADILQAQAHYDAWDIQFGEKALDDKTHSNRVAEMWWTMRDWIKREGILPDPLTSEGRDVAADLTGREYGFDGKGRIQLEKKEDMKKRGLASPDIADALALTFAMPVENREARSKLNERLRAIHMQSRESGTSHMAY